MLARNRIITTLACLVIGMLIIVGFVLIPSFHGIMDLSERISDEQNKIAQALSHASRLRTVTSQIEQMQRELLNYEQIIVEDGKEIDLFSLLEEKHKQYNLTQLIRLNPSIELLPSLRELPLEFQIQGTFQDILSYMRELERMKELLAFKSLTLLRTPVTQDSKKPLALTLKGAIYVLKK